MSLNQLLLDEKKPYLDIRTNKTSVDNRFQMADQSNPIANNDSGFASVYSKDDQQLYYKDSNNAEVVVAGAGGAGLFLAVDSSVFPNQKRVGAEADQSIGLNSNLTQISTTETGASNIGLVISSEQATAFANYVSIKHQDDPSEAGNISLVKTRGSEALPTAVQAGDEVSKIFAIAHNGTGYEVSGLLRFDAKSNQTPTNADSKFVVALTPTNAVVPDDAFIFDNDASLAFREDVAPPLLAGFGKLYSSAGDAGLHFLDSAGNDHNVSDYDFKLDADKYANQVRSGTEANSSISINSNINSINPDLFGSVYCAYHAGSESNDVYCNLLGFKHSDMNLPSAMGLARSRGTEALPTAVQQDDLLASHGHFGYDGTDYQVGSYYQTLCDENWTGTNRGARLEIGLGDNGDATPSTSLLLHGNGQQILSEDATAVSCDSGLVLGQANDSSMGMLEMALSPANDANYGKVYCKTDQVLYYQDSAGVETPLTGTAVVDTLQETYDSSASGNILLDNAIGGIELQGDVGAGADPLFRAYNNADTVDYINISQNKTTMAKGVVNATGANNICVGVGCEINDDPNIAGAQEESINMGFYSTVDAGSYQTLYGYQNVIENNSLTQDCSENVLLGDQMKIVNTVGAVVPTRRNVCVGFADSGNTTLEDADNMICAIQQNLANTIRGSAQSILGHYVECDTASYFNLMGGSNMQIADSYNNVNLCHNWGAGTTRTNSTGTVVVGNNAFLNLDQCQRCINIGSNSLITTSNNNIILGNEITNTSVDNCAIINPSASAIDNSNNLPSSMNVFNVSGGMNIFSAGDDRQSSATNGGNSNSFSIVGVNGPNSATVMYTIDTTRFANVALNTSYIIKAVTSIYRSDANSTAVEVVESYAVFTDIAGASLTAGGITNTVQVAGDYAGTITQSVTGGTNANIILGADAGNPTFEYRWISNISMSVLNVGTI